MISVCVYCHRDVRSERTANGTLLWRAMADKRVTCDNHPYTTAPMIHRITRG